MQGSDDIELLRRYARDGSEEAFAVLVKRYVNLIYSVASRYVGNPDQAEEITQAVFVILARKAHTLRRGTVLAGWLHKTAWFTADNYRKTEIRRRHREQEAYMQSLLNEPEPDVWAQIAPLLDTALAGLSDKDRNAVVLRFFTGKKLSEVGAAMGASEEAAKKRVNRAVEKLRHFFTQRGVVLPTAAMAAAISAHSIQAAPAGLAVSVTGATASGSTLALIKATLNKMLWMKVKTSIATGAAALLAVSVATVAVEKVHKSSLIEDAFRNADAQSLDKAPDVIVLRPTRYPGSVNEASSGERFMSRSMLLSWLFSVAYDYPWWNHVVLPADAPPEQYDLLLTRADNPKERLRREIQRQLGLVAHRELRMTEVLVLEMDPAKVARLKATGGGSSMVKAPGWGTGVRRIALRNQPVSVLAHIMEGHLGLPVFDRTGLPGNYDVLLQWPAESDIPSEVQAIRQAIADQLRLQLISRQEMAELLMVEKTGR